MKLRLFNSLKKKVTTINLYPDHIINVYLCGPTVYDHIHIGNLRTTIIFDVLHRLLLNLNIKVNYVQNITDIDDKIISKSLKLKKTEKEISSHFTKAYLANLTLYNIVFPNHLPRVTNHISSIQKFVTNLLEKGFAYQWKGEIFFLVEKNKNYGKLSGQNFAKTRSVREISQKKKKNCRDFLLWKKTEDGIVWDSPWGKGRPGWHTECVTFIQEMFKGKTIDIHGGGNDLLFPHHENERIQYLASNNKELSKIWLHIAHINWGKEKMSKSLNNVILAKHFNKKYGSNVLRYLILSSSYNQAININERLIKQASDYIQKVKNTIKRLNFYLYLNKIIIVNQKKKSQVFEEITHHLLNNLNFAKVFSSLELIITFLNKSIDENKKGEELQEKINDFWSILEILGFKFSLPDYNLKVKLLIKKWQNLRKISAYSQADEIRNQLEKFSIL